MLPEDFSWPFSFAGCPVNMASIAFGKNYRDSNSFLARFSDSCRAVKNVRLALGNLLHCGAFFAAQQKQICCTADATLQGSRFAWTRQWIFTPDSQGMFR